MREAFGDLWDYYNQGYHLVVTTNGSIKSDETNVMGRGIALQVAQRFKNIPARLGYRIGEWGNQVYVFEDYRLITFPVKFHWKQAASLSLIRQSTEQLILIVNALGLDRIALPRPGCGNGGQTWDQVSLLLKPRLDSRFIVVEKREESWPGLRGKT